MKPSIYFLLSLPLLLLAGCASVPTGPSLMALPGSNKNFDQFRADDGECRRYARLQIGEADMQQAASNAGVRSAAVGTVVGAVAGAAIGGSNGAGIGAGTGLLVGSMAGTDAARTSAYGTQQQYDIGYIQCMYAKGHQVPVSAAYTRNQTQTPAATAPASPAAVYPPPPPGTPPPPPPGVR